MDAVLGMRNRHLFALDLVAMLLIPPVALSLRVDRLDWWSTCGPALMLYTAVALMVRLSVFHWLGVYRRYWRHAGLSDLTLLLIGVGSSTVFLAILCVGTHSALQPFNLATYRTVPLIDGLLMGLAVGGTRFGLRGLSYWYRQHNGVMGGRRVLLAGAGEAGAMVAHELQANPQLSMEPVGFVDDDTGKIGTRIRGLPVLGTCAQIPDLVDHHQIQRVIVTMPSAPLGRQQEIMATCNRVGVATHNLPGLYELLAGYKTVSHLPEIDINRLLRRQPVQIDETAVSAYLAGATVLVTGAGGSIGSELCRQIARSEPAEMILLGHGENSIVEINLDLRLSFPDLVTHQEIADIRNFWRINQIVKGYRPDVIFHAAAHKHVPLMEATVEEAITNNVLGTQNMLRAAEQHGVQRFLLISTDKAVNPTCVMGATKRLGELLVVASARRSARAYMAVRFGNVLGSRGSVIPIFQHQIAAGGPVTITHPEMCRFFMTIPEAVQLVLQATMLGEGGEVFVLDMGQPVRIRDLAVDLIKLSGLEAERDIKIIYTGIRPGEKLREELFLGGEEHWRTKCSKIFIATTESLVEPEALERLVFEIVEWAQSTHAQSAGEQMRTLLPEICCYIDNFLPRPQPSLPTPGSSEPMVIPPTTAIAGAPARAAAAS